MREPLWELMPGVIAPSSLIYLGLLPPLSFPLPLLVTLLLSVWMKPASTLNYTLSKGWYDSSKSHSAFKKQMNCSSCWWRTIFVLNSLPVFIEEKATVTLIWTLVISKDWLKVLLPNSAAILDSAPYCSSLDNSSKFKKSGNAKLDNDTQHLFWNLIFIA